MDFFENFYHGDIGGAKIGDINLYYCGKRLNAPNHSFGPAVRDNFWLIYMREGSGWYIMNYEKHRIAKNMLFVAYPNKRIHYYADPGSVWSINWVYYLENYFRMMNITEENPVIKITVPTALENVFNLLFNEIPLDTLESKFNCISLVYKILAIISKSCQTEKQSRDYIDEAIFFMTNNYDRQITIADVADSVNLNISYFSRVFKNKIGVTPSEWLNNYRLDKAASLLKLTDLKISEVAFSVGFDDPLYFSRRFTKKFGISPSIYKNQG